jgi:sugar phosphate isomerase/epimerase
MPVTFRNGHVPTAFASVSLQAQPGSDLPDKMRAIRSAGFDAMELGMPDLLEYGKVVTGNHTDIDPKDYETIATVAANVKDLAGSLGLELMMLQPFANFEGWKRGTNEKERADAFDRARGWMLVMESAGINILQVAHASYRTREPALS